MRLAMRLPEKKPGDSGIANDIDPREDSDAEVIDLAQRNAFPAVARPAGKTGEASAPPPPKHPSRRDPAPSSRG